MRNVLIGKVLCYLHHVSAHDDGQLIMRTFLIYGKLYIGKIDTYETSILPYEDCCTIFVAKHPVTKPNINRIKKSEERLNDVIDELMKAAIDTTEVIMVDAE